MTISRPSTSTPVVLSRRSGRRTSLAAGLLLIVVFTGFGLWAEHLQRPAPVAAPAPATQGDSGTALEQWWACLTGGRPQA